MKEAFVRIMWPITFMEVIDYLIKKEKENGKDFYYKIKKKGDKEYAIYYYYKVEPNPEDYIYMRL